MEKIDYYRQCIQKILIKYSNYYPWEKDNNIEVQLIFDTERDHYQILELGWDNFYRIYDCVMHLDLKDQKIWIQRNTTDLKIAEDLLEMGIPKEDIVLGLQSPYKRQYTNYGVA